MSLPKAVIFDLGKVLLDFDYGVAVRRLLPRCRVSLDELRRVLTQDRLLVDYETGLVTTPEFFARLRPAIQYEGTFDEFRLGFGDIFTPIKPMIALHAELHRAGIPTYVLSNTNELAVDYIRAQYPWFGDFDGLVLSYEHRAMKPAAALYEVAERMSGRRGAELFYFDDRPENLETAFARGWQGCVHDDPARSRAALAATGVIEAPRVNPTPPS
jgi:FMN phosphatase YigB (HAD superfamily)